MQYQSQELTEKYRNALDAKDMDILRTIAIKKQDVSNVQVPTENLALHLAENSLDKRIDKVVCANCANNHPANYKGCMIRKELQKNYLSQ